jgi:hypothetical protein
MSTDKAATRKGSTQDRIYFGLIAEKTARLVVILLLLLVIAAYAFGTINVGLVLLIFLGSGVCLILIAMGLAWLCVGSAKLGRFLSKHESIAEVIGVFLGASLIGGALSIYLLQ